MKTFILTSFLFLSLCCFDVHAQDTSSTDIHYQRSLELLNRIDQLYLVPDGTCLYRENYPHDDAYRASYLAEGEVPEKGNDYAYLWPFSGSLSSYTALLEQSKAQHLKEQLEGQILVGLTHYLDQRNPAAYASYIQGAALSDRFYDDNIWIGIDFTDLYLNSKEVSYLNQAKQIWTFIESGMDDILGGGIYWVEQNKSSKNTCSNAPGIVYLAKLYQATEDPYYLQKAIDLYTWTQAKLRDPSDYLYWDNMDLAGKVDKTKFAYNTGQMIQAGALLYELTKDKNYLKEAQQSAKSAYYYFFDHHSASAYPVLKKTDNWFIAVMMRGFVELYHLDGNKEYLAAFEQNLNFAWNHMRDEQGLFGKDWTAGEQPRRKWLLDQFALVEMLARLSKLK